MLRSEYIGGKMPTRTKSGDTLTNVPPDVQTILRKLGFGQDDQTYFKDPALTRSNILGVIRKNSPTNLAPYLNRLQEIQETNRHSLQYFYFALEWWYKAATGMVSTDKLEENLVYYERRHLFQ